MGRVTRQQMRFVCEELVKGRSLAKICEQSDELPVSKTILRHVQDNEQAWLEYRKARSLQAELLRDEIIELVQRPLPENPRLAMAEVSRRRLEAEQKDKYIRQLQPNGLRNKAEDNQPSGTSGQITLMWGTADS